MLFLDYWNTILPAARYVFVFRRPWEVVDSLFRRGDDTFAGNPAFAAEVWLHYNRAILEFARRHRDRCLVVEIDRVAVDPSGLFAAVRSQLGIALADPPDLFEPRLLVGDADQGHWLAIRACLPAAEEVYQELRRLAGADRVSEAGAADVDRAAVGRRLLGEWRRTRRAEAQVAELLPQLTGAREAAATAEAAVAMLRKSVSELEGENHRLEAVRTEQSTRIAVLQSEIEAVRAEQAARVAALEAERIAQTATATAVQSLDREIAALRDELHEREAVLAWTAARLRSREASVLRRIRREVRRIAAQAAAVLHRVCGGTPAKAADRDTHIGHRDAA